MNTAWKRIRAAVRKCPNPGAGALRWNKSTKPRQQILASPEFDQHAAQLALDNVHGLYQWASVMQSHELRCLNNALLELTTAFAAEPLRSEQPMPKTETKYGGIGSDAVRAKTGKDWDGWLKVLDKEKAKNLAQGNCAAAL